MTQRATSFSEPLFDRIVDAVQPGDVIWTLTTGKPNRVVAIEHDQLLIETEKSAKGSGAVPAVPAWMVEIAWGHLIRHGSLTNQHLLHKLGVKRSSFVCALLAAFPDVEVVSQRPVTLRYLPNRARKR